MIRLCKAYAFCAFFAISTSPLHAAEKEFTTSVLWQAVDMTGPKDPKNKTVNWRIVDGILTVQEIESNEWVKCIYQTTKTSQSGSVGMMHSGKLTDGRLFSLTLIQRDGKLYYSMATRRGEIVHITYGLCSDELKQYFLIHLK